MDADEVFCFSGFEYINEWLQLQIDGKFSLGIAYFFNNPPPPLFIT